MSNYELEDDITLAKFVNYMQIALYHRRINYFRDLKKIQNSETRISEMKEWGREEHVTMNIPNTNILNDKEIYLLDLHYKHGLSYEEISKITNEKVCTLKQRRNRAVAKLKERLEED